MSSPKPIGISYQMGEKETTQMKVPKPNNNTATHQGSPKKSTGAHLHGGKGSWSKVDTDTKSRIDDPNDPNYVSEDEEEVVLSKVEVQTPSEAVITEYFSSGDIDEVKKALKELNIASTHEQFIKKAISLAMEKQAFERELVSKLLSAIYNEVVTPEKIIEGFQCTLDVLDDRVLDNPDAVEVLGKFLARAIVDEIIPPAFLKNAIAKNSFASESLALASGLVTEKHRFERLAHIWGPGDLHSVKRLKEEVDFLFEEYLTNGDLTEADKSVRKLNAPHFHGQLVKEAIKLALGKNTQDRKKICDLLGFFSKEGLVSSESMTSGFDQCVKSLNDLKLDVPEAPKILKELVETGKNNNWISKEYSPVIN